MAEPETKSTTPNAPDASAGGVRITDEFARKLDDLVAAAAGSLTGGLAAPRIMQAYIDWGMNLALSPGRQLQLAENLFRGQMQLGAALVGNVPETDDARFKDEGWKRKPFSWHAFAALKREAFWTLATRPLPGMDRHNAKLVQFYTRQVMEALSPNHFPPTNPEFLATTRREHGRNLLRGVRRAMHDGLRQLGKPEEPSSEFQVGTNLAATPGKVIYRNGLMELIQYSPTTENVYAEPILIVPAWIMKYYILDLSETNSLVRWLVAQGHTVFMISWKNPDSGDRNLSMDDYRRQGVLAAMDAIGAVLPRKKIHAVGYCVGGTLLAITAAAMGRDGDRRLKTATLFAAQTDFEDAGELKLFIDEMSLYWLDRQMARKGYLESSQMGSTFELLRPRHLIWSRILRNYWFGEPDNGFDIMAWNADGTRMPQRMHIDYLRELYLENRLAQGKYRIGGEIVSMRDVRLPMFVVGTTTDHVAPWKSVYKIRNLRKLGRTTFVLTRGGHNAGIVSQPGRANRSYRIGAWDGTSTYQSAEDWAASTEEHEGSWWLAWQAWLVEHSPKRQVPPPPMGNAENGYGILGDAPGTYVLQR